MEVTPREKVNGYEVRREVWQIGDASFDLTWPADVDALLDLPRTLDRFARDEYMPYWAQPWPASVLLAGALLRGERGERRAAVDIGCGVGVVSLAAARMGWSVVAADYDPDAVAFAALNAQRNGLTLAGGERIDWRECLEQPRFQRVFGSDLLYERRNSGPLVKWLGSALLPGGEAWLSDPNRTAADGFPSEAESAGFEVGVEQVETTAPAGLLNRGRLWRLRRPEGGRSAEGSAQAGGSAVERVMQGKEKP